MEFNERFKRLEEEYNSVFAPGKGNPFLAIRLDGKNFSSFTKQFKAPYDYDFMNAMDQAALSVIKSVLPGSMIGYVQSDEISIIQAPSKVTGEYPSAGRVQKLVSICASAASIGFLRAIPEAKGNPLFDGRVFELDGIEDVRDYIDWRRLDARKNTVSMAASALFSHRQLQGVPTRERSRMLEGTEFEKLPEEFFNGRIIHRVSDDETGKRSWTVEPALRETFYEILESLNP